MTKRDAKGLLERLEAALAAHAPKLLARLDQGASDTKLKTLERKVGRPLPPSFRAFLAWRDGATRSARGLDGLVWLGSTRIAKMKAMMDEIVDGGHYAGYQPDQWWSKGWVPFADDESGYRSLVIDLHGSFGGVPGQVLQAAAKDPRRIVLAPSFEAWLGAFVAVVEAKGLEVEEGGWVFGSRAKDVFAERLRGFPRTHEPEPLAVSAGGRGALEEPTRGAWPEGVPANARWLTRATDDRVEHWLVRVEGSTVTEWTGSDPARLRKKDTAAKSPDAAITTHDDRLRKKLGAGFSFAKPTDQAARGEVVFAFDVGDGDASTNLDLAPDGRTLAVGTSVKATQSARIYLVDTVTGRRTLIHEETEGDGYSPPLVHRVMFEASGKQLLFQIGTKLFRMATAGDQAQVVADIAGGESLYDLFNPHVSKPDVDRSRRRFLTFDNRGIAVLSSDGAELFRLKVQYGASEYREACISPSGKLVAVLHQSRSSEDADAEPFKRVEVWSVDDKEQVAAVSLDDEVYLRKLGLTPDDAELLVGTYQGFAAWNLATGQQAWSYDKREWGHAADASRLAVGQRGGLAEVLRAADREPDLALAPTSLWANLYAENQETEVLRFSDDGQLLLEGGSGGRVYLWKV